MINFDYLFAKAITEPMPSELVKSFFFTNILGFFRFLVFKFFKVLIPDTKFRPTVGHVNATNRSSYLNIICISYTGEKSYR